MITGLSRPQQILYFFEQHQEEEYSTQYISQYICNNFDLSSKPNPKSGISMLQQVNNEVSSNISKFLDPKYFKSPIFNFERVKIGKDYFYKYKENNRLVLPETKTVNKTNKYKTDKILMPKQTNFNFEETQIMEQPKEEIISTLQEDIKAADKIHDFDDPINLIIEKIESLHLNTVQEISFSGIVRDRKFKITIENS